MAIYNMKFKPEPKPKLVQPAAQVLHVVWLVQPVDIHGSLAGPACRPSAHLAGCRNIKESFLSLAGSACRLGGDIRDDIGLYACPKKPVFKPRKSQLNSQLNNKYQFSQLN